MCEFCELSKHPEFQRLKNMVEELPRYEQEKLGRKIINDIINHCQSYKALTIGRERLKDDEKYNQWKLIWDLFGKNNS